MSGPCSATPTMSLFVWDRVPALTLAFRARSHSALVSGSSSLSQLSASHSLPRHTYRLEPQEGLCPLAGTWGLSTLPHSPLPDLFHGHVHIHWPSHSGVIKGILLGQGLPLPLTCPCMRQTAQGYLRKRFKEGQPLDNGLNCLSPLPTKVSVSSTKMSDYAHHQDPVPSIFLLAELPVSVPTSVR